MKAPKAGAAPLRKAGGKPTNEKMPTSGTIVKGGVTRGKGPSIAPDRRWEVEDAMRTIMRAEELKANSSLMRDVRKHAAEQAKRMETVCKK